MRQSILGTLIFVLSALFNIAICGGEEANAVGSDEVAHQVVGAAAGQGAYNGKRDEFLRILRSPSNDEGFSRILKRSVDDQEDVDENDDDAHEGVVDLRELRSPHPGSMSRILRGGGQASFSRILRAPASFSRILRGSSGFSRILRGIPNPPASFSRILKRGGGPGSFSRILRSGSAAAAADDFLPAKRGALDEGNDSADDNQSVDYDDIERRNRGFSRILRSSFSRILRSDPSFSRILRADSSFSRIL